MTLAPQARPIDTDCAVCAGTGQDPDFGGACSECFGHVLHRGGIADVLREHAAHRASTRPAQARADESWKAQVRWTKQGGEFLVVVPRSFRVDGRRVDSGDVVTVTSRNGSKLVALGAGCGTNPYGDLLYFPAAEAAPAAPAAAPSVRPNRFAGPCGRCGAEVEAEAGTLSKVDGRWVVEHVGECPEVVEYAVPAGHYAIASQGDNDLLFVRVDRDPGYPVRVKMIVGGHPDMTLAASRVDGILARIVEAGVEASAVLYCAELERCSHCNRTLTLAESREHGMGAHCYAKYGAAW